MPRPVPLLLLLVACGSGKSTADSTPTTSAGSTGGTPGATTSGSTTTCDVTTVPAPSGDPLTVPLAGACSLADRYGGFSAAVYDIYSLVSGDVADGVVPMTVLEEVGSGGGCSLLRRNNPFCDPPCQPDETCDFDGTCLPYPLGQNLGVVTVGGMEKDVLMSPIPPGNTYFDGTLPHPGFLPGELLELRFDCGPYAGLALHGVGVETIALTDPDWVVVEGEDLAFAWNAPSGAINPGQHVHVRLNIDQHGNTPVQMFCEFPDTGSAAIPSALIDQLMNFGVTGFPNATVTRRTADSTALSGGGCADFLVTSAVDPNVLVEGYIPCVPGGTTCPTGLSCDPLVGLCL